MTSLLSRLAPPVPAVANKKPLLEVVREKKREEPKFVMIDKPEIGPSPTTERISDIE